MRMRSVYLAGICALSLGLTACDGTVAFPGFDERPGTQTPPPPNTGIPVTAPEEPAEPVSDPAPVDTPEAPVPEDPTPIDTPAPETIPETEPDVPAEPPQETPEVTPEDPETHQAPETSQEPPVETPPALPPEAPVMPAFSYHAPGSLIPGSGQGSPDQTVYAPDMVFPIKEARAFPQSMVFQPGGFRYEGNLPGDECIPENYEYPWRDNFCERGRSSSFKSASCPAGAGIHLGQDIRVGDGATCQSMRRRYRANSQSITDYKVVAAEEGVISNISSYTVTLRAGPRTYRYLHLNMRALQVSVGDTVSAGQHIGYVSKDFGFDSNGNRRPTTFHLHFELRINTEAGSPFVPPYTSLVEAYARREGAPGEQIERSIAIASDTLSYDPAEVFEFSE